MFLWWQQTSQGNLWIESRALRQLLEGMLPKECAVREVDFWGERQTVAVRLEVFGGENGVPCSSRDAVASDVRAFLRPLGVDSVEISWIEVDAVEDRSWRRWLLRPEAWGVFVGVLVAVGRLGWSGSFDAVLAGGLAFGAGWFVLTSAGQRCWERLCHNVEILWNGGTTRRR